MTEDNITWKENRHGVEKPFVQVEVGTSVIEMPRRYLNPLTDRTHDLTKLSDDGYLKPFLALNYKLSGDLIDLETSPILSFDKDRWVVEEHDSTVVVRKREPESTYGEMVIGDE